jgi:biopolymer transport protein TolR
VASRKALSQINVTPFVDVMLVLLIIFMVTAPMMKEGIDVELPKVTAAGLDVPDEPLVVSVDSAGKVYLNDAAMGFDELGTKLSAIYKRKSDVMVLLKADARVPYGSVARAMAEIRNSGVQKVGMMTEPVKDKG